MTKKSITSAASALGTLSEGLASIRKRIAGLKSERDAIQNARCPLDEAQQRMQAGFAMMAARYEEADLDIDSLTTFHYQGWGLRPFPTTDDPLGLTFNGAMWTFFAEAITQVVNAKLQRWYENQPGPFIRTDAKPAMLLEIDNQILELEFEEEDLISTAEEAGFALMRRADADPRAVLDVRDPAALGMALNAAVAPTPEETPDG